MVILNRLDYIKEGYQQVNDSKFNRPCDVELTEQHCREVQNTLEVMYQNGDIEVRVKLYLTDAQ